MNNYDDNTEHRAFLGPLSKYTISVLSYEKNNKYNFVPINTK